MKASAALLACAPALALANVNFLTTVRAKPGKADAADAFLSRTIANFHQIKPAGQTEIFGARTGKDQFTVLEQYVSECAALEWTYNETHVEACLPMGDLLDASTVQVQSDAAPWVIQSFVAFLQPPSS
ncbi:hypothetical protein BJX63DRAFT_437503 [Aspergillus granulosus]|uniref:ABM domain-containing protein n=1 Tax=Aspergillus granulosus TaxID=176169 RepID=A0ABR4GUS1_9EURO